MISNYNSVSGEPLSRCNLISLSVAIRSRGMLGREPLETQSTQRHGDRKETLGDLKDTGQLYSVFSVTLCFKKRPRGRAGTGILETQSTQRTRRKAGRAGGSKQRQRASRGREQAEAESKQRVGTEQAESGLSSVIELEQIRFRWLLIQMALKPGSEW